MIVIPGNNLKGYKDIRTENGTSQGRNPALTGLCVPVLTCLFVTGLFMNGLFVLSLTVLVLVLADGLTHLGVGERDRRRDPGEDGPPEHRDCYHLPSALGGE